MKLKNSAKCAVLYKEITGTIVISLLWLLSVVALFKIVITA